MATTEGQSFDMGPYEKIKLCVSVATNLIKIQEHEYSLDAQFFFFISIRNRQDGHQDRTLFHKGAH